MQVNESKRISLSLDTKVDPVLCISCEICVNIDPEVFKMNEDAKSIAYTKKYSQKTIEACESCPVDAISV